MPLNTTFMQQILCLKQSQIFKPPWQVQKRIFVLSGISTAASPWWHLFMWYANFRSAKQLKKPSPRH